MTERNHPSAGPARTPDMFTRLAECPAARPIPQANRAAPPAVLGAQDTRVSKVLTGIDAATGSARWTSSTWASGTVGSRSTALVATGGGTVTPRNTISPPAAARAIPSAANHDHERSGLGPDSPAVLGHSQTCISCTSSPTSRGLSGWRRRAPSAARDAVSDAYGCVTGRYGPALSGTRCLPGSTKGQVRRYVLPLHRTSRHAV